MSTTVPGPDNVVRSQDSDSAPPTLNGAEPPDPEEDSSRALFEELDALLERMLALPVSYLEDEAGVPQGSAEEVPLITVAEAMLESSPPYSTPLPPVTATDEAFAAQATLDFPSPVPPVPSEPEPPARNPLPQLTEEKTSPDHEADPGQARPMSPKSALPADLGAVGPHSALPTEQGRPISAKSASSPQPSTFDPTPLWLLPFVWCNRAFDGFTVLLGPPGRWLRGSAGRAALGWTGLLMLAAACGLFLGDWFGWTW